MNKTSHDLVLERLNERLDQLNEMEIVPHPVNNPSGVNLQKWLNQLAEVQRAMVGMISDVWSDLPEDSRELVLAIQRRENILIWTEDKPIED